MAFCSSVHFTDEAGRTSSQISKNPVKRTVHAPTVFIDKDRKLNYPFSSFRRTNLAFPCILCFHAHRSLSGQFRSREKFHLRMICLPTTQVR